eukprot:278323-Prorocentrum_minimum.AAC.1
MPTARQRLWGDFVRGSRSDGRPLIGQLGARAASDWSAGHTHGLELVRVARVQPLIGQLGARAASDWSAGRTCGLGLVSWARARPPIGQLGARTASDWSALTPQGRGARAGRG